MTMPHNPGNPQPAKPEPTKTTTCGIIALVLGVLGLVLSFIPLINNFAFFLGAVGIVLGIIALVGTFRGKVRGKAIAIVASVCSVLAIVITLSMQASFSKAIDDAFGGTSASSSSQGKEQKGAADSAKKDAEKQTSGVQDQKGELEDMSVNIVSAVKSVNDYNGKPTVLVTYEWTNKTDKNSSFMVLSQAQVFQNGRQLDAAIYGMEQPEGYDADSQMSNVQPGASMTTTVGYVLEDDSPVTVEVTDLFSLNDKAKVEHTFQLQ